MDIHVLVSDKHFTAFRFQSVSPGADALVWFSCSQGWKWMVHRTITVISCCSNSCHQTSVKLLCWWLLLSSAPRVHKSTELLWHKTPDFTPDMQPPNQTTPQSCRLQNIDSHSGMRSSETATDVKRRWWAVVINRMAHYISQGRVETPIRRGEQFCCSFIANLLQYLYAKNYQSTMRFDKVTAKIEGCNFFCLTV